MPQFACVRKRFNLSSKGAKMLSLMRKVKAPKHLLYLFNLTHCCGKCSTWCSPTDLNACNPASTNSPIEFRSAIDGLLVAGPAELVTLKQLVSDIEKFGRLEGTQCRRMPQWKQQSGSLVTQNVSVLCAVNGTAAGQRRQWPECAIEYNRSDIDDTFHSEGLQLDGMLKACGVLRTDTIPYNITIAWDIV